VNKNNIVLALSLFSVLLFLGMFKSCSDAYKYRKLRDKEVVKRLDLEEKVDKLSRERNSEGDKLKGLTEELEAQKKARAQAEKALQAMQALKQDLDKADKEKVTAVEELKDAQPEANATAAVNQ
jgi:flagellar capping protein FliD